MDYAVIKSGGKQYKISQGQEILVDKLTAVKGETYTFPEVLLLRTDDTIAVGNPNVSGAKVTGKIIDVVKGEKVTTSKFKAKVHYRRKMGFRATYTKVRIESISTPDKAVKSEEKKVPVKIKRTKLQ